MSPNTDSKKTAAGSKPASKDALLDPRIKTPKRPRHKSDGKSKSSVLDSIEPPKRFNLLPTPVADVSDGKSPPTPVSPGQTSRSGIHGKRPGLSEVKRAATEQARGQTNLLASSPTTAGITEPPRKRQKVSSGPAIGSANGGEGRPTNLSASYYQKLSDAFPHGYRKIHTAAARLRCGFYAIMLSMRHQTPQLPCPTLQELKGTFASDTVSTLCHEALQFNKRNFRLDQLALTLREWGKTRGLDLWVGGVIEGGGVTIPSIERDDLDITTLLWVHYNGLNHFSGLRSKFDSSEGDASDYDVVSDAGEIDSSDGDISEQEPWSDWEGEEGNTGYITDEYLGSGGR